MHLRPQEVIDWGRQRTPPPSITDARKFQTKWIAWWGNCQPKWRAVETWPFPRDEAEDEDWTRLNITGSHGLFAVVMSTSLWAASANLDPHRAPFDAAVADLHWVIENLIRFNSRSQVTQSEADPAPGKFPGHRQRESGKRKVKPSFKASHTA
jgi:hypothetical protein